ncbi:N-acetyltransferase [Clostridium sp. 'deep sea']|uniref:arsinothricin resistance N-acetyltransferase ArsN1 family A n=1 Tax=Clostridium sp. 'deep sea' TaxID=2779445 RepID=UPI001896684D|nr:arsinothricin resistance N-acetyltransferase ArsN1 family A [Clostridium sp. 'deep sea']QOR36171.1 N-acetyltransferase [Clostridium sp. 'deep sea']
MRYTTRLATREDIHAIKTIYNQGIDDRIATLETHHRTTEEMKKWFRNKKEQHKVIVVTAENNTVVGWASLNIFNPRKCYDGVADLSVYVERTMRGKGLGKILLNRIIDIARAYDFHKIVLSTFEFNELAQGLYQAIGFRKVGTYEKQGKLDGKWVDVTIMEKLI